MKKRFAISIIAISSVVLLGCEDGSYFNPNTRHLKSESVSRLEASGADLRVYEFTPVIRNDLDCIFVSGTKKGDLFCTPKLTEEKSINENN